MFVTLPALSEIPYISHGFTFRRLDNGHDFDLDLYNRERLNLVEENLKKLTQSIGFPTAPVITCRQVHQKKIIKVDLQKTTPQEIRGMSGDGLITNQPNVIIAVLMADCLPLLFIDKKKKAIGAIHAGRKGTMASIAKAAIEQMKTHFGTMPENLIIGIGPGIKKCCYEVDILEANLKQVIETGVLKENIFILNQCTFCRKDLFFSYRADNRKTGRMIGFVMLKN